VIFMDQGKVLDRGTPQEFLAICSIRARRNSSRTFARHGLLPVSL